jgi:hypothetical protein
VPTVEPLNSSFLVLPSLDGCALARKQGVGQRAGKGQKADGAGSHSEQVADSHPVARPTSSNACFIISPIGDPGSAVREHADKTFDKILVPALTSLGLDPKRVDHHDESGNLTAAIVTRLLESPLCIAVLTGLNPNVMYEVGVRHAWGAPVVHVAEVDTKLPTDISQYNTLFYSFDSEHSTNEAVAKLKKMATSALRKRPADTNGSLAAQEPVFAEARKVYARRYALDAVFNAKKSAVKALCAGLRHIHHEMDEDFERGLAGAKPLRSFKTPIIKAFAELRTKVFVFEAILADNEEPADSHVRCRAVLGKLKLLNDDGLDLKAAVWTASSSETDFRRVAGKIDNIIQKAEDLIKGL